MLPTVIPTFAPAQPVLNIQTVPGVSGVIDYTEALTGFVPFQNRQGTFEFIVLPDMAYETAKSTISDYLAGRGLNCILDDDPSYFYSGRFWVNEAASNRGYGTIAISYDVDPYKYNVASSEVANLWAENLPDLKYKVLALNGSETLRILNPGVASVKLRVTTNATITLEKGAAVETINTGTKDTTTQLPSGITEVTFTGTASVRVEVLLGKSL